LADDPIVLLLTNQNVELQRQVTDLSRDLEDKRKETEMLYEFLDRPSIATMNDAQIQVLAEMLFRRIMGFPINKKDEAPA